MDDIIYELDNWSIIKLLGGLTVVLAGFIGSVFYLIKNRLLDKWKTKDQKEIEELKGVIDKNNSVLTTVLAKSQPDKILEKKLAALETIWKFIIDTKHKPPAPVTLAYSILADKEFTLENLRKLSKGQIEPIPIEKIMMSKPLLNDIEHLRYIVPTQLWTTIFIYQAFVNRICYVTVNGLQKNKFEYWKKDDPLKKMLGNVLDERELNYIYGLEFQSYDNLLNLLEHKILMEMDKILSGESHTEDSLKAVKRISELKFDR